MTEDPRELDPLIDEAPSRYVVGVDLGTTNCAVAYVDTEEDPWRVRVFPIAQLTAAGQIEPLETLPSFHYQAAQGAMATGALRLPWNRNEPSAAVGVFARDEGAKTPGRLIASAKSWLCHAGVDRTAELLPWQGAPDVERLSPVEVSACYLKHIRDAWDHKFPKHFLSEQDIVLTLPASFDEVARELTVAAAARADLPRVVLIEEPQAAFYAWVYKHSDDWRDRVTPGQKILVCDIGGGTSDFTLIRVRRAASQEEETIKFHRVAVGDHLILGGDNLDLALAHHLEPKLGGNGALSPGQWDVLVRQCQRVKETLLGRDAPPEWTVHLPGTGSRVIGGALQVEAKRDEVQRLLVDGFLPRVRLEDQPQKRQSGFQEFGLPYAADPGITRYLAGFLTAHRHVAGENESPPSGNDPARPDAVLLNGGFFAAPALRERLLEVLRSWFTDDSEPDWSPSVLDNDYLHLAVARGAAYYGMVRRGEGVRIAANLARSYYIGVESDEPAAVCLVPGSAEPGQDTTVPNRKFQLTISEPVEFPLYVSSTRLTDEPGDLTPIDLEQMKALPPIRTVLRARRRSEKGSALIELHAHLTEIGTIDLWCSECEGDRSWRLQFDVRSATQTDLTGHESAAEGEGFFEESAWRDCYSQIAGVFSPSAADKPEGLMKRLGETLGGDRSQWPPSLLRRIWEALMELESGRRRSPVHEARWLNLLGYALRPGYGLAVDDWRVAETWRVMYGKSAHSTPRIRDESLVLWRRIAGGLSRGQQVTVAEPLLAQARALLRRHTGKKRRHGDVLIKPQETAELWRLLGSLELLAVPVKLELGDLLVKLLSQRKLASVHGPIVWALGRLGQRSPVYGPLNTVAPRERTANWLEAVFVRRDGDQTDQLAVMQLARRTHDRHRDLPEPLRRQAIDWLEENAAPAHYVELVCEGGRLNEEEQGRVLGEALPKGLRIQ